MEEEERLREQQRRQAEEEQRRIAAEVAREQAKTGWGTSPSLAVKSPVADGGRVKSLLEIQKEEAKKQLNEPKKDKKVGVYFPFSNFHFEFTFEQKDYLGNR